MESTRKDLKGKVLIRKQRATSSLRTQTDQTCKKRALVAEYHQKYGIYVSDKEQQQIFKKVDNIGLEIVLKKKLAH